MPPRRAPLSVRLSDEAEDWLRDYAAETGSNPNAVIARLVDELRDRVEAIRTEARKGPHNEPPLPTR